MKQGRQGFILIAVLLIMVVVSLLVIGTAFTTVIDRSVAANQQGAIDAYYIAKAGAEKYKTVAFQTYRYYLEHLEDYETELSASNPVCGNLLSIGLDLNRDGDLNDVEDLTDGKPPRTFDEGNGTYTIEFNVDGRYIILKSVGRVGRSRSTVQIVAEVRNVGVLSYPIFTGSSQIYGNAQVFGGIYAKGSGLVTEPVIKADDNFGIHNFYSEQTLRSLINRTTNPVAPSDFLKNDALERKNLCAHLRVQEGYVKLDNKVTVGDDSIGDYMTNLAAINVGASGSSSEIRVSSSNPYTDAKTGFDLKEGISFPKLAPLPGESLLPCTDNTDSFLRSCLREASGFAFSFDSSPNPVCQISPPGFGTSSTLTFNLDKVECTNSPTAGFKYDFTDDKGTLEVYGMVNFRGYDLDFVQPTVVNVADEATFFVEKDSGGDGGGVTLNKDFLPSGSFPDKDVLGIIAEGRLSLTGGGQTPLDTNGQAVAGMFYAGERAVIKGATVFGTVTTREFCTAKDSTTPSCKSGGKAAVVYIPGLEYNLPPGFSQLTNATVPTFRVASFERR